MLSFIVWIVIGAAIGLVASRVMRHDGEFGLLLNVVVGILGAALAGFVLSPMFGLPTMNQDVFHLGSLLISLVGAVILLALVALVAVVRRGR